MKIVTKAWFKVIIIKRYQNDITKIGIGMNETISIVEGEFYKTHSGLKVGPMERTTPRFVDFCVYIGFMHTEQEQRRYLSDGTAIVRSPGCDIVSIWTEKDENRFFKDKLDIESYEEYFKRKIQYDEPAGPCVLHAAMKKQFDLQVRLGTFEKIKTDSDVQQFLNQNAIAIFEENMEILRETAYKNSDHLQFGWKKGQKFNLEKAKEETIDMFHFFMNLLIIFGISADDVMEMYHEKNQENKNRQDRNY